MKLDLSMNLNFDSSKLCTPAKIYFVFSVLSCIIMLFNRIPVLAVFTKLIFAFLWTFVLGWLCSKGYKSISWFLVLLPYVVIALAMFGIAQITQHRSLMRTLQLQGAYGQEAMTMPPMQKINNRK